MFKKTTEIERITKLIVLLSYLLMLGINILEFSHGIDKLEAGVIALNKVLTLEEKQSLVVSYVQLILLKNYEIFKDTVFNDYYLMAWKEILLCTKEYVKSTTFITSANTLTGKYELMDVSLKLVSKGMEIYNDKQHLNIDDFINVMRIIDPSVKAKTATILGFMILSVIAGFSIMPNLGIIDWFTSLLDNIGNYFE